MTVTIGRRKLLVALGGAAAAWPLAARAQQPAKLPTIGYFGTASASAWGPWTTAFGQRLRELVWIEGRTVAIHYRWTEGRAERLAEIAAEFVRLKVDVIVTGGNAAVAAKQASSVIPIVFAFMDDPVSMGLVESLARPGGNVTGLSMQQTELAGKRLELLREVVPGLRRLAIMANVDLPNVAGGGRDSGDCGHARPRCRRLRNPASRGYRTRLRGAQEPRAGTLCCWRRARNHPPGPNQYLGARRATADDLQYPGVRRSGRSDVLRTKHSRLVSTRRRFCRQDSARGEAGRNSGRAADQVRSRHQPYDR